MANRRRPVFGGGRFVAEVVIGEGGTARVWRGRDTKTGQAVAIKELRRGFLQNRELVARFLLEAAQLEKFHHTSIVELFGRGPSADGVPCFACTYAAQGSLAHVMLQRGPIAARELLTWMTEVLDALEYVHRMGIVHRDVKPENILVDQDDVAMLCDFGIALWPSDRGTIPGDQGGTPTFMPPEQVTDFGKVNKRADLYALGVTLFTTLTGQTGMMLQHDALRREALRAMPPRIAAIVDRATRPKVADRYASADLMSMAIADVIEELP